ncbi:MAG TPA: sugar-binding domain-containing protein, partial [Terracidiphilus sp.]
MTIHPNDNPPKQLRGLNPLPIRNARPVLLALVTLSSLLVRTAESAETSVPAPLTIGSGWQMQDVAKVPQNGRDVSVEEFDSKDWYIATVPGTVLTTLVNNHIYAEPLYGENNRPESIPESLAHTSWWFRTTVMVPASYAGKRIWLNFDGINYASSVWINGAELGTTRGAFLRG